jgi:hypothetical protein
MIYISIGTTGNVDRGKGLANYMENLERPFEKADDALAFLEPFQDLMYHRDWETIKGVLDYARKGEEVDPELEIRDRNGVYTNFMICIRGHQDVFDERYKDLTLSKVLHLGDGDFQVEGLNTDGKRVWMLVHTAK